MSDFKRFLNEVPITENDDFIIYGNNDLDEQKDDLLNYLSREKTRILDFFGVKAFDKTSVNLFNSQEVYLKFTKQFFEPAAYSKGNFANKMINYYYDLTKYKSLKRSLIHEYVHLVYQKLNRANRVIWLDEGLAFYLSRQYQSLENDYNMFKRWYFSRVISKDKEIPDISFLKQHGSKYGKFIDMENNKYNGYDLSYLMVRYLVETNYDLKKLMTSNEEIERIEEHILNDCINYYNNYFLSGKNYQELPQGKIVYHGSPNGNIEYLTACKSTHQKECIYATDNKTVALLFMGKGNGDLDTRISTVDGKLELLERRKGVFETLYNHDGYLYELDGSTFSHYDYLWSLEVISFEKKIEPLKKTYFKNIWEEILKEEKKGNIKIYRYPDRPNNVPLDNSDLIDKFISFDNQGLAGALEHMLSIYPEFKNEVSKKLNQKVKKIS